MAKVLCNILWLTVTLVAILVQANRTLATARMSADINQTKVYLAQKAQNQNTLANVSDTDWAFQALKSLVERYNCIPSYPNSLYRGDRILTRSEFAMSLNLCLDEVNKLITTATTNGVNKEDLTTLRRLQTEFAPELASLQRRTENLKFQTTQLAAQQFSTTTKLTGEIIFALSGAHGGDTDNSGEGVDPNLILSDRVRLNINTSFRERDQLSIRLQAQNTSEFNDATGTDMARLGFTGDSDNKLELSRLEYRFPIGEQVRVYIEIVGGELNDFTDTLNPLFSSSSRGAISRFGRRNPIYRQSFGSGVGLRYELSDAASLRLGFIANDADEPGSGITGSRYGAIVQLNFEPNEDIELGLTYVRSYNNLNTGTGSQLANDPFDRESNRVIANSYGFEATFQVSPAFTLGGWVGLIEARAEDLSRNPEAKILNYAVTLAFPDLGKKDNLAGIVIGQPPKAIRNDLSTFKDQDTSLHLEVFYRFQATDNLAITPGLLVITNPEHDKNSDTIYVGTVRTTFTF